MRHSIPIIFDVEGPESPLIGNRLIDHLMDVLSEREEFKLDEDDDKSWCSIFNCKVKD